MEILLIFVRMLACAGAFWLLISYHPEGARYRPGVSALSVLIAGCSLTLALDAGVLLTGMALADVPVAGGVQVVLTALALLLFAALRRCHGNVAELVGGWR